MEEVQNYNIKLTDTGLATVTYSIGNIHYTIRAGGFKEMLV